MFCAFCLNTKLCSRDQCFVPKKGNYSLHSVGGMQSSCLSFSPAHSGTGRLLIPNLPLGCIVKVTPNSQQRLCRNCCKRWGKSEGQERETSASSSSLHRPSFTDYQWNTLNDFKSTSWTGTNLILLFIQPQFHLTSNDQSLLFIPPSQVKSKSDLAVSTLFRACQKTPLCLKLFEYYCVKLWLNYSWRSM